MNERIKQLMREACKESIRPESVLEIVFDGHRDLLEKFALLIVRECANIANNAEPYQANDLILKHFGVEE